MGKEAHVEAVLEGGVYEGRLQFEPPKLIFRGASRRVFEGQALNGVRADAGDLVLADGSRFRLGERQAASWANAIANPKGRLEKLGFKPGVRIGVVNLQDSGFFAELAAAGHRLAAGADGFDLLFYGADSAAELTAIGGLVERLAERGALWVVSFKGKPARIKDTDVMAAAKAHGLVGTKVCAFSATRTALKFVRRRA
jgi:hypothetical protein